MDYIFPDKVAKVFRRPSERTQLEASLMGLSIMIIGSIGLIIYFVFMTDISIWFKVLISFSGVGFFLLQSSSLVTTYLQYYTLKTALGLYPEDKKLLIKISEAKDLIKELNELVKDK
jgi:preprotein translocase subunit Sss1